MSAPTCAGCGKRPALYFRRQWRKVGRPVLIVGSDESHTLCSQCWRAERNRDRAVALRDAGERGRV